MIRAQTICGHIITRYGRVQRRPSSHATADRVVDAFQPQPSSEAHSGSVSGDEHSVGEQRRHGVEPTLRNEVGGVFLQLGACDVGRERRVRLQPGDHGLGPNLGFRKSGNGQHRTDRDRVSTRVDERPAGDSCRVPDYLEIGPLIARDPEARFDLVTR